MMSKQNVPELRFPEFSGEWEERTLENISNIYDGTHATPDYVSEGIPFFSVENVSRKDFVNSKYVSREAYEVYKKRVEVEFNDILMTRIGSIGNVKRVDWHFPSTFYVSLALLKLKKGFVPKYIEQLLKSLTVQKNIVRNSLVTAVPQKINLVDLKQVKINLATSKSEQLKIGEFLSKVDRLIELEEKKLELLEEQKKGYMQKIFSQELRFKDENGNDYPEWEKKTLEELIERHIEVTEVNNQYPVLTSSREGIFLQNEYFSRNVASTNNVGYNVVPYGYFTYRHMSDDLTFKFNINNIVNKGIVSTLYPVFKVREGMNDIFLKELLNNGDEFKRFALLQKQGGSRTYMYFNKLIKLKLSVPCLKEQMKIADFFEKISKRVLLQADRSKLMKNFKTSLLSRMFI